MSDLINQPTLAPTRKVTAGGIAGILTVAVIGLINNQWPGVGDMLGPTVSALIVSAVSFVASYMTKNKAV